MKNRHNTSSKQDESVYRDVFDFDEKLYAGYDNQNETETESITEEEYEQQIYTKRQMRTKKRFFDI